MRLLPAPTEELEYHDLLSLFEFLDNGDGEITFLATNRSQTALPLKPFRGQHRGSPLVKAWVFIRFWSKFIMFTR